MTIEDIKRKRGVIKGQLTRFKGFLDLHDVAEPDLLQIETRLETITGLLDSFNELQIKIEEIEINNEDEHQTERETFENNYFNLIARARKLSGKGAPSSIGANNVSDNTNVQSLNSLMPDGYAGTNVSSIKLPTLDLPRFDGDVNNWLFFRDTFNSIIHKNQNISDIQKFHYLRLSLKDDAAEVIKALEVSDANYEIAWELLLERYENKKLLVQNHVKSLFNLTGITKESLAGLRGLLDGVSKHMRALTVLGLPTAHWDTLIIHMVVVKLDPVTRRAWEMTKNKTDLPELNELITFLKEKCSLLEMLNCRDVDDKHNTKQKQVKSYVATYNVECSYCSKPHLVYNCAEFLKLSVSSRINEVKRLKLCFNCLKKNHSSNVCRCKGCYTCNKRHNTLLHVAQNNAGVRKENENVNSGAANNNFEPTSVQSNQTVLNAYRRDKAQVLLSTAVIKVADNKGVLHAVRVLLDSGSQSSFITETLCKKLNLTKLKINCSVLGINTAPLAIKSKTNVKLQSFGGNYHNNVHCLIVKCIAEDLPAVSFDSSALNIPENITLADPKFNTSSQIDMLIGADIFWDLLCVGQIKLGKNKPILQKTQLGWIVSGEIPKLAAERVHCKFSQEIREQLKLFWEIEEYPNDKRILNSEEKFEKHFVATTTRAKDGRFIVQMPLKHPNSKLGRSRESAERRLITLEKKLCRDSNLQKSYSKFMQEYEALGHMTKVANARDNHDGFYLPHHCVTKQESLTTKVRVVFDGSAKSSTGYSLNDIQMTGAVIQQDLFTIISRFRKHDIVLMADITKMYRQILIDEKQRSLQKILWRSDPTQEIQCYELNTITYGLASSSFLAIRCIHELANEFQNKLPRSSRIIKEDFYVDDLLTGGSTKEEIQEIVKEVTHILESGKLPLNKWASNDAEVLGEITSTNRDAIINISDNHETKTLGLYWNSSSDTFHFSIKKSIANAKVTKRFILSMVAQIFDPLGLLSPIIISAKIILQRLWRCKSNWDESIPQDIYTDWILLYEQLHHINDIKFPRQVFLKRAVRVECHGFSDASELAYGAVIYMRSVDESGRCISRILCSKSRVAPLKCLSVPRLELCGALLLAKLYCKIKHSMKFDDCYFWCDSSIVLAWIRSVSRDWKVFVANRISEIQTLTNAEKWHYVKGLENPADLMTRGVPPEQLKNNQVWLEGPNWLSKPHNSWPLNQNINERRVSGLDEYKNESRVQVDVCTAIIQDERVQLLNRFSSINKLTRIIAYCIRFKNNCLTKQRVSGPLTVLEVKMAESRLIAMSQQVDFKGEILSLNKANGVSKNSKLLALNPFIDDSGLLRVGGRLNLSQFHENKKNPVILSAHSRLAYLIVRYEHITLLHSGSQALMASLRERYWIIGCRNLCKKVIRECMRCFRFKAETPNYLMADLPRARITQSRPFSNCGTDYAGPISIRDRKGRNYKALKAYICLFICFATKAVHLELVSDLTTEAFLAALRRMSARRGKPAHIYSDNGTNYIGAQAEISKFLNITSQDAFQNELNRDGIQWHLIPPRAPHFGGLWEAGVKSTKFHMRRVIGEAILTYEEFYTFLTQIEACLNSRPLCPLSDHPDDLNPLTPAHFLIGTTLMAVPDENLMEIKQNRLSKFQHVQQMAQHFWSRWSKEYISELQTRKKWTTPGEKVEPGVMVLVKEDGLPPLKWKLGRVLETYSGADGITRVASIKTEAGVFKRPVKKLCCLPAEGVTSE